MSVRAHREGAQDRRNQALEAAMLAIAERGLDAVSMRDIAVRAGMSAGHILYYFGSKDALLLEVLRWSEDDLAQRRRAALAQVRGRDRRLRRFCEWYLPDAANDPRWNLWAQLAARPPTDPATKRELLAMLQAWVDDLAAIVGDAASAERHCSLMDGLAMDILLELPGRTRARALRIVTEAMARDLEGSTP